MNHDALLPAGPLAAAIAELFWVFTGVCAVVYLIVMGFLVSALRRRPAGGAAAADSARMRNAVRGIGVSVGLTTVMLLVLALSDFLAHRALAGPLTDPLRVRVTAHQWWWELEYLDEQPTRHLRTANELHVPVGRPVQLEMTADDVIHSFWVPSLQGKKDLLPGYTTTLVLQATRAGRFEGQCAEFCGFQHAHMSIDVVAQGPAEFTAWQEAQRAAGAEPATAEAQRGRDVFMASTCVMCHTIQGTDAAAITGPDLTHLASRQRLAAGTLPVTQGNIAAWVLNPQAYKPGTRMPATRLAGDDLAALSTYLASLR